MAGGEGEEMSLEFTPTWVVAVVCTMIVGISLAVERLLHYTGERLWEIDQKPLFEALQKIKEELMLLGFISLLLTVFQSRIVKICVKESLMAHLLPCSLRDSNKPQGYCASKEKVPLLSLEALHQLHIFIFILALMHVIFSVLTLVLGGAKMREWNQWEEYIAKANSESEASEDEKPKATLVKDDEFIKERFKGIGKRSTIRGWWSSFFKQFYGSVTKSDYRALRFGFINEKCKGNKNFNFHNYMKRALEDDFRGVLGINWYLWVFVFIFLLLNINGWHTYFWIAFVPFVLLLAVGTKLEHIIIELAQEVAEKHMATIGEPSALIKPSDKHFWFENPRMLLYFIHLILFQNAFEMAFFFWIWVQYGFHSCIMGQVQYTVSRLIVGVFIQVLCSYSTLPLYALVTQMGNQFKAPLFNKHKELVAMKERETNGSSQDRLAAAAGTSSVVDIPPAEVDQNQQS